MIRHIKIELPAKGRGFHLITNYIMENLKDLPSSGILNLFLQHTSAALTINENADPDVRDDLAAFFDRQCPDGTPYFIHTMEGDDDMPAHVKSSVLGVTLTIPIQNGRLAMGIWQGIYLCEFRDVPQHRKLLATLYY
ncbi:MAG: secondary thiamine-phosphate synthase enzyme YjbQ [Salinivirgaceae bacterium]|nr:secondary thiamine-phosphate synthase enzyme YjbQ [Salinivirgaceae bacterium]